MNRSFTTAVLAAGSLLVLTACGGGGGGGGAGGGSGGGGGGAGGTITVTGTVVDDSGTPIAGAGVLLGGDPASLVTTGSDGAFQFAGVTPPYTLTVRSGKQLIELRGLTRPTVVVPPSGSALTYSANLAGEVSGPSFPLPTTQKILLGATNGVMPWLGVIAEKTFSGLAARWAEGGSTTTDLVAMEVTLSPAHLITGLGPLGRRAGVILQHGTDQAGLDFALTTPVSTTSTVFTYDLGAYTTQGAACYASLTAGGARFPILVGGKIPSGTSVLLPDEGGTLAVIGEDSAGNRAFRVATAQPNGTTDIDLPASTALAAILPGAGSTSVGKTPTLSWTPVSGAALYRVHLTSSAGSYWFMLPPESATFTVPDYSALGLPLAGATTYEWYVVAVEAADLDTDAVVDPARAQKAENPLYTADDARFFISAERSFTTVP